LRRAVDRARGKQLTPEYADAAELHGVGRHKQGYTVPLVVREARILFRALADCVQQNLLAIQMSHLITDMVNVWETVTNELEISVKAFVAATSDSPAEEKPAAQASRAPKAPRVGRSKAG
jgi:hypothetical protein